MKQFSLLIIGIFSISVCFAQRDTLNETRSIVKPYFETGFAFIQNDFLKEAYKTNTMFNWGVGIHFGDPDKHKIMPYLLYSSSKYTAQFKNAIDETNDSILHVREFIMGTNVVIKRFKSNFIRAKTALILSKVDDDFFFNSDNAFGIQLGIGYETKFIANSRIYIDYSYDFIKLRKALFRDYDMQKISIGLIL